MADTSDPNFQLGWRAAISAAQLWHEAKAKQSLILARRDRFPKKHEQEAEHHTRSAAALVTLSPDDV